MKTTIWKQILPPAPGLITFEAPDGAEVLTVAEQNGSPVAWCKFPAVNAGGKRVKVSLMAAMTGRPFDLPIVRGSYLSTVQLDDPREEVPFVLHYFEVGE